MDVLFGLAIGVSIILSIVLATYEGGFISFGLGFLAFCLAVVWIIEVLINRKVDKQPKKQLTSVEIRKFKTGRILVLLGFAAWIFLTVLLV